MRLHWNRVMSATYDNTRILCQILYQMGLHFANEPTGDSKVGENLCPLPVLVYLTKWLE